MKSPDSARDIARSMILWHIVTAVGGIGEKWLKEQHAA